MPLIRNSSIPQNISVEVCGSEQNLTFQVRVIAGGSKVVLMALSDAISHTDNREDYGVAAILSNVSHECEVCWDISLAIWTDHPNVMNATVVFQGRKLQSFDLFNITKFHIYFPEETPATLAIVATAESTSSTSNLPQEHKIIIVLAASIPTAVVTTIIIVLLIVRCYNKRSGKSKQCHEILNVSEDPRAEQQ